VTIAGRPVPHESARGHVTGDALYTDDLIGRFPGILHAWPVLAPHAHAILRSIDAAPAQQQPGVVAVLTGADVPGMGDTGPSRHDEPLFPTEVMFHRQPVAWVLGETQDAARAGAAQVRAEYDPLPAILTIEEAIAAGSFLTDPSRIARGDMSVMASSAVRLDGELAIATASWRSAARSISTSRHRRRSPGSTRPARWRCNPRRSTRPRRRKWSRGCSAFRATT
jgi:xanthine dehydrogenase large subunit